MSESKQSKFAVGEWLAVVAALVAAAAAIWQGYLTREALRATVASNLQGRQIDACTEFLFRANKLRWSVVLFGQYSRKENLPAGDDTDVDRLRFAILTSGLEYGPPAERLDLIAGSEMRDALKSANSATTAFFILADNGNVPNAGTEKAWLQQFDDAITIVSERCRAIMLGHSVGLI